MSIIGINGSFIRKPATGIGQVSWHFIQELLKEIILREKDKQASEIIIYLEERVPKKLQKLIRKNSKIKFKVISGWYKRDDLIRKILWEKFWLPKQIKKDDVEKFLSLYQSVTILPKKTNHLMFVHDVIPNIFPEYLNNSRKRIYYWLVNNAIKKSDKILTNSKFSQKEISRVLNVNLDKIKVVYLACDSIFSQKLSENERVDKLKKYNLNLEDKYIFSFGGVDIRKNVERVIEAYGKLLAENKNIPDLVIGGDFQKHLIPLVTDVEKIIKETCQTYNLKQDKFKTIGFVEQEDLPALYQSAEVFIYPSLYEGFGMPVLEAMLSAALVVTSGTTSIPEIISAQAGYLINNPESVDEIKEQLKIALGDSPENKQAKINQASQEAQKFSWQKMVGESWEEVTEE